VALKKKLRQSLKKLAFGGDILPARFFIEQPQPQAEVSVWLHGCGEPRDVTRCQAPASAVPCTFWVAFPAGQSPSEKQRNHLTLKFCERHGAKKVLGQIALTWTKTIAAGSGEILVFEAKHANNYCQPKLRLMAHRLLDLWRQRRRKSTIKLSPVERRAMGVLFICPRSIQLVSVVSDERANIFPLNVAGDLHDGYFAFALTAWKIPAQFLERARRFALSVTPIQQGPTAFKLAENHNNAAIQWDELPFKTRPSRTFAIPVPVFSPRIREMEIESVHRVGSHSIFVARTISDEGVASGAELSVVHGFYQSWRLRRGLDVPSSVAEDARIRSGVYS
jgi:hypothetical protein